MSRPGEGQHWLPIWTTALVRADLSEQLPDNPELWQDGITFKGYTIRQTFRVTLGAQRIRLRISNVHGDSALSISRAAVSLPQTEDGRTAGSSTTVPGSSRRITVSGMEQMEIPPGATFVTDPIDLSVDNLQHVTVDLYLAQGQLGKFVTMHRASKTVSHVAQGDHTGSQSLVDHLAVERWFYVGVIEGLVPSNTCSLACFGDSITDRGMRDLLPNQYFGWIDRLFDRLQEQPSTSHISVLNLGIGGDAITKGGLKRFDRDVMALNGIKYVFLLMGINDIGQAPNTVAGQEEVFTRLVVAYEQIISKTHARGIPIFGSTVMPFCSPPDSQYASKFVDPLREETRLKVNEWLREKADFDYLVDWSKIVTDPEKPGMMKEEYHYRDYVHPSIEGFKVMGDALDLSIFERFA